MHTLTAQRDMNKKKKKKICEKMCMENSFILFICSTREKVYYYGHIAPHL